MFNSYLLDYPSHLSGSILYYVSLKNVEKFLYYPMVTVIRGYPLPVAKNKFRSQVVNKIKNS